MPHITLRFAQEMRQAIYEGRKCCTTRAEVKGRVGDMFVIGARDYRIIDIATNRLGEVRDTLFYQEGLDCPGAFEAFWRTHHRGEFLVSQVCYTHWFARVEQKDSTNWLDTVQRDYCPPEHQDGCPGNDCCANGNRCVRGA